MLSELEWIVKLRIYNELILFKFLIIFVRTNFQKILSKQGIKFRLGTKYTGAEKKKDGTGYVLALESVKDGNKDQVNFSS